MIKSKVNNKLGNDRIYSYLANPKTCTNCSEKMPYNKRHDKFCNKSCAASYNNKKRKKQPQITNIKNYVSEKQKIFCFWCKEELSLYRKNFAIQLVKLSIE